VADFGLAKVLGRESGLTLTESALGSPNYMSPEQASGHTAQLTLAADVYSLGAILYELLTGKPPFQGGTAVETMRRVMDDDVIPPRQLNPAIDADLETICLKCLQKLPGKRYDSAEALAADLERWLGGQPIQARPVGPVEQFARWCRRQPALATALGLSLALLLVVVIGTAIAGVRIARAERTATEYMRQSLLGQARVLRMNSGIGMRDEGLKLIRQAVALGGSPEFRQELRHEMLALFARTEVNFVPQPQLPVSPDPALNLLSPQGTRLATVTNLHTVRILNAADGSELTQFAVGPAPIRALEGFSREGRYLALRDAKSFSIWDTETAGCCFSTNQPQLLFSFAHSGSNVIIQTGRKIVTIYELPSMRVLREVAPYVGEEITTAWSALSPSPDGSKLAAVRRNSRIVELIDLETGTARDLINQGRAMAASWSPDGARLAVGTTVRRVIVWDTTSHQQIYVSNILPGMPNRIAFNPQRSLLVAGCEDRMVRFFDGLSPQPVFELAGEMSATVHFDAHGARVGPVFRNATAGFLQLQRPAGYFETVVSGIDDSPSACSFSADGEIIAVGALTNVALCTAAEGTVLTNMACSINAFCFDPREQAVVAAGVPGIFRWSLSSNRNGASVLASQKRLVRGPGWRSVGYSANGSYFVGAKTYTNTAYVFDRTLTKRLFDVGPHSGLGFVTISPDGRWVATGSEVDRQLRVWNAKENRQELSLPGGIRPKATFSPDGKWLGTFGVGFELREVGTWQRVPLFPDKDRAPVLGAGAFSADGKTLAVVTDVQAIHLIDLPSLLTFAVLRPPGATEIQALAFSPDGTRLAAVGDALRLRVWNLPVLRQQLAQFKLDWPSPGADAAGQR
jgi:WD40 repeat protein